MIRNLFLKLIKCLCCTPCLLSLFVGCGKEVVNSNSNSKVTRRPELNSGSIILNIKYVTRSQNYGESIFQTENSGWLVIPEQPYIKAGNALVVNSRIFFNLSNDEDDQENPFYCDYTSTRLSNKKSEETNSFSYIHTFNGCFEDVDHDGQADELNYKPGNILTQDRDRLIKIDVESSDEASEILELESELNWY